MTGQKCTPTTHKCFLIVYNPYFLQKRTVYFDEYTVFDKVKK